MMRVQLSSWVTHERLDDEVIAINLETGAYYALDGTAADCWTLVAGGATVDELVAGLSTRYGVAPEQARADAEGFLAALVEQGLGVEADGPPSSAAGDANAPAANGAPRPYAAPVLARYDDLDDLLLLDPIHEVDDAGWPIARAE
jgi:hypothetical protein